MWTKFAIKTIRDNRSYYPLYTQEMLVQKSKLLMLVALRGHSDRLSRKIEGKVTRCDGSQTAAYVRRGSTDSTVNRIIRLQRQRYIFISRIPNEIGNIFNRRPKIKENKE